MSGRIERSANDPIDRTACEMLCVALDELKRRIGPLTGKAAENALLSAFDSAIDMLEINGLTGFFVKLAMRREHKRRKVFSRE